MGGRARCVARSTGTRTFVVAPPGGVVWVTTNAHLPSGDSVTAKSPSGGVPWIGNAIGGSEVREASAIGVTALGHTTQPTGPAEAGRDPATVGEPGVARTPQPASPADSRAAPTPGAARRDQDHAVGRVRWRRGSSIGGPDPSDAGGAEGRAPPVGLTTSGSWPGHAARDRTPPRA